VESKVHMHGEFHHHAYAVLHCNSTWMRPFLESIRWYFSLILLLETTSPRLIST